MLKSKGVFKQKNSELNCTLLSKRVQIIAILMNFLQTIKYIAKILRVIKIIEIFDLIKIYTKWYSSL